MNKKDKAKNKKTEVTVNQRLVHEEFRKEYGRPFYTWDLDDEAIKLHEKDYKKVLKRMKGKSREIDYRREILLQMLYDIDNERRKKAEEKNPGIK